MNGCDVSVFQGAIPFDVLAQSMRFCISKATEGVGFQDATFDRNWTETARVGMIRGAYHFARPDLDNSADDEATYFLSRLGPLRADDVLALDYEVAWDGDAVGWCLRWLDQVRSVTGKSPFIYLNRALVKAYDWTPAIGYPLWLAAYDGDPTIFPQAPWPAVAMKQWTSSGAIAGLTGHFDLNTWQQEEEEMDRDLFNRWFDERLAESPEYQNTAKAHALAINEHVHLPGEITPSVSSTPLIPPVSGARYASADVTLNQVIWLYPDGTLHTFVEGKEVTP